MIFPFSLHNNAESTSSMTSPSHHSSFNLRRRGVWGANNNDTPNNTTTTAGTTTPTVNTCSDESPCKASGAGAVSSPRLVQIMNASTSSCTSSPQQRRRDQVHHCDNKFVSTTARLLKVAVRSPFQEVLRSRSQSQILVLQGGLIFVAIVAMCMLLLECFVLLPWTNMDSYPSSIIRIGPLALFTRSKYVHREGTWNYLSPISLKGKVESDSMGSVPTIVMSVSPDHTNALSYPEHKELKLKPQYGGLDFDSITEEDFQRHISETSYDDYEATRWAELINMNRDKDESDEIFHDDELEQQEECRRNKWRSALYVNCQTLHEFDRIGQLEKVLGSGYYRQAFLMKDIESTSEQFVLKELMMPEDWSDVDHQVTAWSLLKVQREAIIMEQMHASPRIVDIYGFCGISVVSEFMAQEVAQHIVPGTGHANQSQLDGLPHIRSVNNYTVEEKLDMCIEMAESIADLHGHSGGVIINGDVHPVQWLRTHEGVLKMNDFNNAEIPGWNDHEQKYCKVDRGSWSGVYRSPEEYDGDEIDEQVDVYSMGNNVYTLLTGLWPFYEDDRYSVIGDKVMNQERPYVDHRFRTRSYIEARLVEIMESMWVHDPQKRPSIFEVIQYLRDTKEQHQQIHKRSAE